MNDAVILERVKEVAADVLGVPLGTLTGASSPDTVENWDSVQHLSLVMALEQAFGVSLDPTDVEKMRSLDQIASLLARKSGK